jgi:hypothetical protein
VSKPLLFISHRYADRDIARVIAEFVRYMSRGEVDVYTSSDAAFGGAPSSPNLNDQLRRVLWNTDTVILVYTSGDGDWSYCMWECGVATNPSSPETNFIVFQCGRDVPHLFASELRVDARRPEDLRQFTQQMLSSPHFFPRFGRALAPDVRPDFVQQAAQRLYKELSGVLPGSGEGAAG